MKTDSDKDGKIGNTKKCPIEIFIINCKFVTLLLTLANRKYVLEESQNRKSDLIISKLDLKLDSPEIHEMSVTRDMLSLYTNNYKALLCLYWWQNRVSSSSPSPHYYLSALSVSKKFFPVFLSCFPDQTRE